MAQTRREINKRYRLKNPEKCKENNKRWIENHPLYFQDWYKKHKEQNSINCKKWREENKEHHIKKCVEYKKKHPKKIDGSDWHRPGYINEYRQTEKGKEVIRKHNAKRRMLGFIPLNKPFNNSIGHHINKEQVIYMPREIHRGIRHSVLKNKNMESINREAFKYV